MRADKKVGSSLEVAVYLNTQNQSVLEMSEKDLADIFITSQVHFSQNAPDEVLNEYKEDETTVWVTKAAGEKCCRCWKYRKLNSDGICEDCAKAVEETMVK